MSEPKSLGGDLPVSRRCHGNQHQLCRGSWTSYPDDSGPCECPCHLLNALFADGLFGGVGRAAPTDPNCHLTSP